MLTRWTQHLQDEETKEKLKKEIFSAKPVLERLKSIIEEDMDYLDRSEEDQRIYDKPNWDYRQAHKNGTRQTYNYLKRLIDLDQQRGTISDYKPIG